MIVSAFIIFCCAAGAGGPGSVGRVVDTVTAVAPTADTGVSPDHLTKDSSGEAATYHPKWVLGVSGKLRALFMSSEHNVGVIPVLRHYFGDSAIDRPGVYPLADSAVGTSFSLVTELPFSAKVKGYIGGYHLGLWPGEKRDVPSEAYDNPDGFIVVTPDNVDTPVSEHFKLGDFITHDQKDVWPKYLVLSEALVDKLELIIQDLATHGHPNAHLVVMSGFRTPEYNAQGVGRHGGRAKESRHQYGDAADIYVDNTGAGRMQDLNHDGKVDSRDARVLLESVERVEAAHPELVGGAGIYRGTRAHGPFLHVDVRGNPARWAVLEPVHHRRHKPAHKPASTGTGTPS